MFHVRFIPRVLVPDPPHHHLLDILPDQIRSVLKHDHDLEHIGLAVWRCVMMVRGSSHSLNAAHKPLSNDTWC